MESHSYDERHIVTSNSLKAEEDHIKGISVSYYEHSSIAQDRSPSLSSVPEESRASLTDSNDSLNAICRSTESIDETEPGDVFTIEVDDAIVEDHVTQVWEEHTESGTPLSKFSKNVGERKGNLLKVHGIENLHKLEKNKMSTRHIRNLDYAKSADSISTATKNIEEDLKVTRLSNSYSGGAHLESLSRSRQKLDTLVEGKPAKISTSPRTGVDKSQIQQQTSILMDPKHPKHNSLFGEPQSPRLKKRSSKAQRRFSEGMDKLFRKDSERSRRFSDSNSPPCVKTRHASLLSVGSTSIVSGISGISVNDLSVDPDGWVPDTKITHSSLPHVGFSARNEDWNR